jgi:hypothetical protein
MEFLYASPIRVASDLDMQGADALQDQPKKFL